MKKIIVILGDIASGKSTLADNIKESTHFLCLKKDVIKECLADQFGFSSREENLKLSHAAMDIMFSTSEVAMTCEIGLILEANFHSHDLKRLQSLIEKYQYQAIFICLSADLDILYNRFLYRVPTRHKAHLSMGLHHDFQAFSRYVISSREDIKEWVFPTFDVSKLNQEELYRKVKELLMKEGLMYE
jgi:predicted kinase